MSDHVETVVLDQDQEVAPEGKQNSKGGKYSEQHEGS
jgi:hypothetical protein